ncbi:MAG: hypothetical protein AAF668_01255 [Pseudomonadota bacterium]
MSLKTSKTTKSDLPTDETVLDSEEFSQKPSAKSRRLVSADKKSPKEERNPYRKLRKNQLDNDHITDDIEASDQDFGDDDTDDFDDVDYAKASRELKDKVIEAIDQVLLEDDTDELEDIQDKELRRIKELERELKSQSKKFERLQAQQAKDTLRQIARTHRKHAAMRARDFEVMRSRSWQIARKMYSVECLFGDGGGILGRLAASISYLIRLDFRAAQQKLRGKPPLRDMDYAALINSPLFMGSWYIKTYPETASYEEGPLAHYLDIGVRKGYNPNPFFLSDWYIAENDDVALSGQNPLGHFARKGMAENRAPHPQFDLDFYNDRYPDIAATRIHPFEHFVTIGAKEGRAPNQYASLLKNPMDAFKA